MKRNTNAVFKAFNDAIVSELAAVGIHPAGPLSWHPETPEFVIETRGGTYRFHHGLNVDPEDKRPLNFLDVFGRFDEPDCAKKFVDCNPYSGKWNHAEAVGYVATVAEAQKLATSIVTRILSV